MTNPVRPASLGAEIKGGRTVLAGDIARRRFDTNTGPSPKEPEPATGNCQAAVSYIETGNFGGIATSEEWNEQWNCEGFVIEQVGEVYGIAVPTAGLYHASVWASGTHASIAAGDDLNLTAGVLGGFTLTKSRNFGATNASGNTIHLDLGFDVQMGLSDHFYADLVENSAQALDLVLITQLHLVHCDCS